MPVLPKDKCDNCGAQIKTKRFCDLKCCWEWRRANKDKLKGTFKSGIVPWNVGTIGVMKPNSGTFQKGRVSEKWVEIGTVTIRPDKQGASRAWVKIADNNNPSDWVLRSVVVWEKHNGPVPKGMVIHHKDRNPLNDSVDNLEAMTRADHLREHRHEYEDRRCEAASTAARVRHMRNRKLKAGILKK